MPLEPRLKPGNAQGSASSQPRTVVSQPAGLCPCLWCCGQALLSLPCVGAPGLTLGLVGHEAEQQGVHFSTVAATFSASASSSAVPVQQLGVAVTKGTLLLLTQAPGQPWLLDRQKRLPGSNSQQLQMLWSSLWQSLSHSPTVNSLHNPFPPCFHQN